MQWLADVVARRQKAGIVRVVLGDAPCEPALLLFDCSRFHPLTPDCRPRKVPRALPGEAPWQKSKLIAIGIGRDLREAVSLSRARSFSAHLISDTPTLPFQAYAPIAPDRIIDPTQTMMR